MTHEEANERLENSPLKKFQESLPAKPANVGAKEPKPEINLIPFPFIEKSY